jgi:hypothetical protein
MILQKHISKIVFSNKKKNNNKENTKITSTNSNSLKNLKEVKKQNLINNKNLQKMAKA